MNRSMRPVLLLSFGILILAGCAARKPGLEKLYAGLKEKPGAIDVSVLAGKTIVIDPGHGGFFDGAMGVDSLREADANLGVALYLWGLCADAGADARLTRTADRDLLPQGSKEQADDLKARVAKANELDADVFISIHHNAILPVKRNLNRIEVYYRSSDPDASLELAQDVQVHLARNLGIEISEAKPGNYLILRLSTANAAILGEASYLSHPAVEERLKLSEKQKLEAEAYFLGLVEYFARGVPSLTRLSPPRDTLAAPAEISFAVSSGAGIVIDPASARITIGSAEIIPLYDPARGVLRIPMEHDIPNGAYPVQAAVRSIGGATARSKPFTLFVARPARHVVALRPQPKPESLVSISVKLLDELASPVADGTPVIARALVGDTSFSGESRSGVFGIEVPRELIREAFVFETRGLTDTIRFAAIEDRPSFALIVTDARTGESVSSPVVAGDSSASEAADASGRILVSASGARAAFIVYAGGYRPSLVDTATTPGVPALIRVPLEPLFGGVLKGKGIAIDPAGGGSDAAGRGANGLRGASVNFAVARHLRDLLERSGAKVVLTREGDEPISAQERVYIVNRSSAELAIGIRHGKPPEGLGSERLVLHYPGSARGQSIAGLLAGALASVPPLGALPTREWAGIFLQQTACTACELYCGPIEDGAIETAMGDQKWLRLEAETIFAATLRYFGYENLAPNRVSVKVVSNGTPVEGAAVCIDQLLVRSTDALGSAEFDAVDPGAHLVAVRARDGRNARVTIILPSSEPGGLVIDLR